MSVLLAPIAKYDYVSMDYWAAISDPDSIHKFNWAEYVLQRLMSAVRKYNSELNSGSRTSTICGCHLFLQVLYLDSIDLREFSFAHDMVPRIACFTAEAIRAMTALDCVNPGGEDGGRQYGLSKLRTPLGIMYSWGTSSVEESCERDNAMKRSLWAIARTVARVLKLPNEAAGPLFSCIVEIQREFQHVFGNIGLISIDVLLHLLRPYVHGLIYISSAPEISIVTGFDADDTVLDECSNHSIFHKHPHCGDKRKSFPELLRCPSCGSPDSYSESCPLSVWVRQAGIVHGNVERIVHLALAKFHLAVALMKADSRIDFYTNEHKPLVIYSPKSPLDCSPPHSIGEIKSPWDLGGVMQFQNIGVSKVFECGPDFRDYCDDNRPIVLHHTPKYIVVSPSAAMSQLSGNEELEMDLFDALVRRMSQRDDLLYSFEGRRRWRHFFESDILASVLGGCFEVSNSNIRNQLVGRHIRYEVSNCVQLFFPVLLQHRWVCLCWCTVPNKIVIFDPIRRIIPGFYSVETYGNVVLALKSMMSSIAVELFQHLDFDFSNPVVEVHKWHLGGNDCLQRTGFACAYFCLCYDGFRLVPDISKDEFMRLPQFFQAELSMLEGNLGFVPWRPMISP